MTNKNPLEISSWEVFEVFHVRFIFKSTFFASLVTSEILYQKYSDKLRKKDYNALKNRRRT